MLDPKTACLSDVSGKIIATVSTDEAAVSAEVRHRWDRYPELVAFVERIGARECYRGSELGCDDPCIACAARALLARCEPKENQS